MLKRFHATFQQYGDGSYGGLRGELRYHVDTPLVEPPAPVVEAGGDLNAIAGVPVELAGSITIAGQPAGSKAIASWMAVTGPARVAFSDAHLPRTQVTFPQPGGYVLRLTAVTGAHAVSDLVSITVSAPGEAPVGRSAGALHMPDGAPSGLVDLQIGAGSSFTGSLNFLGFRYALRGELSESGLWTAELPAAGRAPGVSVSLRRASNGALSFSVRYAGVVHQAALSGLTPAVAGSFPEELVGFYNFALTPRTAVAGRRLVSGIGHLQVNPKGVVLMSARCPDRSLVYVRTAASADGSIIVFGAGNGGRSILAGVLKTPINLYFPDLEGSLHWSHWRTPSRTFPARFHAATLDVEGSPQLLLKARDNPVVGREWDKMAAEVVIDGLRDEALIAPVEITGLTARGVAGGDTRASFRSDRIGHFNGQFRHPVSGRSIPFEGVMLLNRYTGFGHFFAEGAAGSVLVRMIR